MNTKRITLVDFLKNPSSFEQIIDVREYNETPDMSDLSTLHIPLSDFESQIHKINPTKKTLVFCQKGIRSQMAIDVLQQNGSFNALYNLSGGVYLYQKQKSTL
jgi:rhodanese-related sulfurtransferase